MMKTTILLSLILLVMGCTQKQIKQEDKMRFPETKEINVINTYHGMTVTDPYQWLEHPENRDVIAWTKAQNSATEKHLSAIPQREKIKNSYRKMYNFPKWDTPARRGDYYYYFKNDGLQNQSLLYRTKDLNKPGDLVLNPNKLSQDGTLALTQTRFSPDHKLIAVGLSQSGSDRQTLKIFNPETKIFQKDYLTGLRFPSIAWSKDNKGFYYNKYPKKDPKANPNGTLYEQVLYHTLGTDQANDRVVFEDKNNKNDGFAPYITEDGRFLTLSVWAGTDPRNKFYYKDLKNGGEFVRLIDELKADYSFLGNRGGKLFFETDLNAPKKRIITIDLDHNNKVTEILPEKELPLSFITLIHNQFVAVYLKDAKHMIHRYTLEGTFLGEIKLPVLGSIYALSGREHHTELFIQYASFLNPASVLKFDFKTEQLTTIFKPTLSFDTTEFESKQIFYPSKDGTKIPMFLVYKKGLKLTGDHPTLLYGYGGFNVSLTPFFSISKMMWVRDGGVFAVANLRGGGEYGEQWHQAGMLEKKQNVFDDFIAAGEWLINNKYTSNKKLAVMGGSNGGLLTAAMTVQRPDLFGAVVCQVPLTDMLRYHTFTVGHYWIPEYGNATNSKKEFNYIYKYSPYHNVKKGVKYPPILIASADTDDRVVPAHAKKFAAMLQKMDIGNAPILLRIEMKAGHGHGKPTEKIIQEVADTYSFLYALFGMNVAPGE